MRFKSKIIALTIGLIFAFAGSLGSYAYFSKQVIADDNSITLGEWKNNTPNTTNTNINKTKLNEVTKPTEQNNKDKVSKKANTTVKTNNSDKKKEQVKAKEESKEVKLEEKTLNKNEGAKKEVKAESKKVNIEKNNNKEGNKTTENNVQNNKENK